jgi:hypothetical protein
VAIGRNSCWNPQSENAKNRLNTIALVELTQGYQFLKVLSLKNQVTYYQIAHQVWL